MRAALFAVLNAGWKVSCLRNNVQRGSVMWNSVWLRTKASSSELPRITMPQSMVQRILKEKEKRSEELASKKQNGPVRISCKRKQFNHHSGQKYSDFTPQVLASGGWKHRKSKGDHFTMHATSSNPSIGKEGCASFDELGLSKDIIDAAERMDIITPTSVQAAMIPAYLGSESIMCCAETGSGKTLAYLLPIVQKILDQQAEFGRSEGMNQPCAVILTPSRELAEQILSVCQKLCEKLPIVTEMRLGGRGTQARLRFKPQTYMDILVTTPGVFSKFLTRKVYSMERLSHVVFDEADTLFDDSFNELSIRVIRKMMIQGEKAEVGTETENVGTQVAFVGATMPRDMQNILGDVIDMETITNISTPHLHLLQVHVPQKFVRTLPSECPEYLVTHLKKNPGTPTIVFCNNFKVVSYVACILRENGLDNVMMHANMSQEKRDGRFTKFQDGSVDILVCTDIASRGLDTIRAQHVINYTFPPFESDYIHRAGRVGRVGSIKKGFVLSFISQNWEVDLLWKIEMCARKNMELKNVNANIKRKLTRIIERKFGINEPSEVVE